MTSCNPGTVRLAAVGDLLLAPPPRGVRYHRAPELIANDVRGVLAECDVSLANFEFTLPGDGRQVATEPRVVGTPELVRRVAAAGFNVVSLANNHAFDCMEGGFLKLRGLLDELGIRHFGAGLDLDEAAAPAIMETRGVRVAFLGAADQLCGVSQFAGPGQWGVAPLDAGRLARQIRALRAEVQDVIVSVHWGEERFLFPSPAQIEQAHRLVDAGAAMVLGHHPHVLQGLEFHRGAPIAYSLGNFIADEVPFSDGDAVRWNRTGRTGCIVLAELTATAVADVRQLPTYDPGRLVELDQSGFGARRIAKTGRAIAQGVTPARYRRERLWVKGVKPVLEHLRWSSLRNVCFRQVRKALRRLR
jgi:poly-gamma-glutamate capsule biosynthesis protein CapA/YwtB (metallophosphatase superfamily)